MLVRRINRRSVRPLAYAVPAVAALALASQAGANLLVYEPFDYDAAANGLNGKNGGMGYGGAYSGSNNADVVAGSFSYTDPAGRQLVTAGNRALMDSPVPGDPTLTGLTAIAPNRNLQTSLFSSLTGPLYISFVGQQTAGDQRDLTVSIFAATNGTFGTQERLSIGHGNPSAAGATDGSLNWGAYANAVGQQGVYSTTPATTKSLVVVRIDLNADGDNDRFRVYVNPGLGSEPAVADVESSAYNFLTGYNEINRVRMRAGQSNPTLNLGASQAEFDEIRIGTSYADVTPMTPAALPGDANYNGRIDADDFAITDRGAAKHLGGYSNGDFNGSGGVDAADYAILYQSFAQQGGHFSPEQLAAGEAMFGAEYMHGLVTAVPEPAAAAGLAMTGALVTCQRRRRAGTARTR